jgi:glucose-1-phosphate cytidylyltransferase
LHSIDHNEDWEVTIAYTGEFTMTGARVAIAAEKYLLSAENFAVTYGDGLTDVNLLEEYKFHLSHNKIGTVLGINPPSRFGELKISGNSVIEFEEKPEFIEKWINGGYFFFKRAFLSYLSKDASCILERSPLKNLALDNELSIFNHRGFWACIDTQRDLDNINNIWKSGNAPWVTTSEGDN